MSSLKIDRFFVLLASILILISAMLIFTFRGIFNAFAAVYDVGDTDTESELRINEASLEEAKGFVVGQKAVIPLHIKNNPAPVVSITPTPKL